MKLYGYADYGLPPDEIVPSALAEVTLCATPAELRRMAEFLNHCALEMDRMGDSFGHLHLADRIKTFDMAPHFVVTRED